MLDNTTTVRAETVEKAIEKGLNELNVSLEEAEVHVISEGKKGLFGFGKQDAIVEITVKTDMSFKQMTEKLEEEIALEESTETTDVVTEPETDTKVEDTQPEPEVIVKETPEKQVPKEQKISEPSQIKDAKEQPKAEKVESPSHEGLPLDESCGQVAKYIEAVINEYGAHADVDFEISGNQVTFNIDTDKSGLVIGKHGKIINSMQVISQTLLQSLHRKRMSILLNVGDYRDRRAHVLEQIAKRTAEDVLKTKQTVILDPLPAYERKQIHAYLARKENIKTHSEGKEPNRYLVVEYDASH